MDAPEVWRPVLGFEKRYEVSDRGQVRRILKLAVHTAGYHQIAIRGDGKYKNRYVHRLVLEAFHGPPPNDGQRYVCNHKNGIKTDNRPENLEWVSFADNTRHAHASGLNSGTRGQRWGTSKATHQRWLRNGEITKAQYRRLRSRSG